MLTDHIGILLYNSLDAPRVNRLSPTKPATYFVQLAFPPSATQDLQALVQSVAPGGNLQGLEIGVNVHSQVKKPIPGVPQDWLLVRASTQFAPTLVDTAGQPVVGADAIKATFYPGRRVRGALTVFPWAHQATNRKGVSFNLAGVMDAGPGERLSIGDGVTANEFQKYAAAGTSTLNPFEGVKTEQPATSQPSNPFAGVKTEQPATSQTANPFAQQ